MQLLLVAQISKSTLKLSPTAILARLLIPEDYGLIGMTTVVSSFVKYQKKEKEKFFLFNIFRVDNKLLISKIFYINSYFSLKILNNL